MPLSYLLLIFILGKIILSLIKFIVDLFQLFSPQSILKFQPNTPSTISSHSLISCKVLVLEEGLLFVPMLTLCRFSFVFFFLFQHINN